MSRFDTAPDRRRTGSYKWDSYPENVIPMWVADMDFHVAPAIEEALLRRVEHGIFGYTLVEDSYYEAVTSWFLRRHGWKIDPAMMIYTSGVVPAVSAIIKAMTHPGDKVVLHTPAYNCFFSSIRNNGCEVSASPLVRDSDGSYHINYEDLESRCADERAKVMILCNPHNPTGRIWTREELERVAEICERNGVFVISDEIHCELTYSGRDYVPYATVAGEDRNLAVCVSPSKAFNIAGLQIANIVCGTKEIRTKVDRAINDNEVCDVNPFGVTATVAAYGRSEEWLEELRAYLWENWLLVKDFFEVNLPKFQLTPLEATYLVWIDCRHTGIEAEEIAGRLVEGGVALSPGTIYGDAGFMRLNIACPRSRLRAGLERLAAVFSKL